MILRIIFFSCLFTSSVVPYEGRTCLTGYMTDVQSWVDENGDLTTQVEPDVTVDLSSKLGVVSMLRENMDEVISKEESVKYLSLAKCQLGRVPKIFHYKSIKGQLLSDTLEYLTLYGNSFTDTSTTGDQYQMSINGTGVIEVDGFRQFTDGRNIWSTGFEDITFTSLRELDLRACSIESINEAIFKGMTNLEALYLGENNIYWIDSSAFDSLTSLVHLDISRNLGVKDGEPKHLLIKEDALIKLTNLKSIDMSYTKLHPKNIVTFHHLGAEVQRLSLCYTGLSELQDSYFKGKSIKYLDVSGNNDILNNIKALSGLEKTLQILYASDIKLKEFDVFEHMKKLEILKVSNNELSALKCSVALSLAKLKVLDLESNRMTTWLQTTFLGMKSLRFLSLKDNNINVLTLQMMNDIKLISYIGLSGNSIVCNCHTRELIETAAKNEIHGHRELIALSTMEKDERLPFNTYFNTALHDFNDRIVKRKNISFLCKQDDHCKEREYLKMGTYLLFDFNIHDSYSCLLATESKAIPFAEVGTCHIKSEHYNINDQLDAGFNSVVVMVIPGVLLPVLFLTFLFRKKIRYFLVVMKNSAALSLISNDEVMGENNIYNYDVFVSYCHDDRAWVLDHLLPHLETDCSVSVCLHERDFQVGLSILENIVSCMDRSRTIMLIISKQFLMSQWCQFEMHLAQHRLLETRREDLTLILLEEVPRRLRPNTLHYLMLTKTYIVWPEENSDQTIFWRRLKKSVVTQRNKLHDNVTLA